MATNTPNYNLVKPAQTDFYNVNDFNGNSDKIDAALKALADLIGGISVSDLRNTLTSHIADNTKHKTADDITRIANAAQKTGDTFSGNIVVQKVSPGMYFLNPNGTKQLGILYNVNDTNDFGITFRKDTEDFLRVTASRNVQFQDASGVWSSLADLKSSVSDGKTLVANAITGKGVVTSPTAEFATMATNIGLIMTGQKAGGIGSGIGASGTLTVSGLTFKPKLIAYWNNNSGTFSNFTGNYVESGFGASFYEVNYSVITTTKVTGSFTVNATGFAVNTGTQGTNNISWIALA